MIPLDTLPGWPVADEPSLLHVLVILFAIPGAIALVVSVVGMARRWAHGGDSATDLPPDVQLSLERARASVEPGRQPDELPAGDDRSTSDADQPAAVMIGS